MTTTRTDVCAVSSPGPHVALVVTHRTMRSLIVELLERDLGCWTVSAIRDVSEIEHVATPPDLVIVDTADFDAVRCQLPATFALALVVVIGPEPDPAYREAAVRFGAGAWLSRDRIAEELCPALCSTLACATENNAAATGTASRSPHLLQQRSDD